MPKVRPQSFPVTKQGMGMAKKATARNRNKIAQRRNQQIAPMNLQQTVNEAMPAIATGVGAPSNTGSNPIMPSNETNSFATQSAPLTKTNNPQNVLSSGFQTNFSANPMQSMKPNNVNIAPTYGGGNNMNKGPQPVAANNKNTDKV